jgi:hypothetical protein
LNVQVRGYTNMQPPTTIPCHFEAPYGISTGVLKFSHSPVWDISIKMQVNEAFRSNVTREHLVSRVFLEQTLYTVGL